MTGPRVRTQGLQQQFGSVSSSSCGSSAADTRSPRHPQAHSSGLQHRLSDVIDVVDVGRLVECFQVQRQLEFQHLVRRYISQILYGCTSTSCTTPTCLSCNRRLVSRPFRPPTQLTARALAHFLASQDDPYRSLCPNELKVAPDSLAIEGADGIQIQSDAKRDEQHCTIFPTARSRAQCSYDGKWNDGAKNSSAAQEDGGTEQTSQNIVDAVRKCRQTKKDPKSLGQNLYDTVAIIYSYSKQIPNPLSVLALLRAPNHQGQLNTLDLQRDQVGCPSSPRRLSSSSREFMGGANGHMVNEDETPTQSHRQHPQREPKAQGKPLAPSITSEVLNNGEQIHKIRHHLPQSGVNTHTSTKPHELIPLDGTVECDTSQSPKMRKKALTLDIRATCKAAPTQLGPSHMAKNQRQRNRLAIPAASRLNCDILDHMKDDVYHYRSQRSSDLNFAVDFDPNRRFRPAKPFVNRSLFYTLSDPEALLQSFRDENEDFKDSSLAHLDSLRLTHAFRDWNRRNGALVFDSLCNAVEALFRPPPDLDIQKSPRLRPSRKNSSSESSRHPFASDNIQVPSGRHLSTKECAHIVMICIHALTSLIPVGWPRTWIQVRKFRSWGMIIPAHNDSSDTFAEPWLDIIDGLEYEPAIRLADRLLRGVGARVCFEHILARLSHKESSRGDARQGEEYDSLVEALTKHLKEAERLALHSKHKLKTNQDLTEDPGWTVTATFMEWLRTIIVKQWDGKAEINKWSSVGTAMRLLSELYAKHELLNLRPKMFETRYFEERLDDTIEPIEFLNWTEHPNSFHILQYPCLFRAQYLVGLFRTINFTSMMKQYEHTERTTQLQRNMAPFLPDNYWRMAESRLRTTLSDYLVLDVSRENPLKDTLDQLWGQERRLLLKPLKVKMGMQEGEVGLDHGGVTYEFFRIVLSEAFKPDNGMFTVSPESRMIWFQPGSLEPFWKFEMLGVLFSLAVYNGITLPVTFPLALYYHLLGKDHPHLDLDTQKTGFIRDGWPVLAKSFDQLLEWDSGDVADVFLRTYTFSYDAFGRNVDIDMGAARQTPSEQEHSGGEILVTNANREAYVRDYIFYLTYGSVVKQLKAFCRGFHTCLHPKSLHLFTPTSLKSLVEGTQEISITALKHATRYEDGYSATHATIADFWNIIEGYSQRDRRQLLEFVTASERVPVTGFESMHFVIVRHGGDTERLPTSSTCFGKLMLPEYASKEKMKTKLGLAIQNSKGFGVV